MSDDNVVLPYKLGFAALTAAVLISASDVDASYIPTKTYPLKPLSSVGYSWEDAGSGTFSLTSTVKDDIKEQIQILHEFASQIIENSLNLKPEAANMINKRFWDLLA